MCVIKKSVILLLTLGDLQQYQIVYVYVQYV